MREERRRYADTPMDDAAYRDWAAYLDESLPKWSRHYRLPHIEHWVALQRKATDEQADWLRRLWRCAIDRYDEDMALWRSVDALKEVFATLTREVETLRAMVWAMQEPKARDHAEGEEP